MASSFYSEHKMLPFHGDLPHDAGLGANGMIVSMPPLMTKRPMSSVISGEVKYARHPLAADIRSDAKPQRHPQSPNELFHKSLKLIQLFP